MPGRVLDASAGTGGICTQRSRLNLLEAFELGKRLDVVVDAQMRDQTIPPRRRIRSAADCLPRLSPPAVFARLHRAISRCG